MIRDQQTLNLLQDSIARFVREVPVPHEDLVAETDTIPDRIVGQMRELGLYVADYAAERFYREVRLFRLYEGTSQIQQLVIARNMIEKAQP